jgi:retron-type reverse transcriptase
MYSVRTPDLTRKVIADCLDKQKRGRSTLIDARLFDRFSSAKEAKALIKESKKLEPKPKAQRAEASQDAPTKKTPAGPIQALSNTVGAPVTLTQYLFGEWVRHDNLDHLYSSFEIPKASGKTRRIDAPERALRYFQRKLYETLVAKSPARPEAHGFVAGRSNRSNAASHVGAEVVVNMDLRDFFPTISAARVYGLLKTCKLTDDDVFLRFLTAVCVMNEALPQGAPTSPVLANLVCRRLDARLSGLARKAGATYTRYADDLSFSGPRTIIGLLPKARLVIGEEGFTIATEKTRILGRGTRQDVTGLTVNARVSVPRALRRRLRAAVHAVSHGKEATWKGRPLSRQALLGHIAYLESVHPSEARSLRAAIAGSQP